MRQIHHGATRVLCFTCFLAVLALGPPGIGQDAGPNSPSAGTQESADGSPNGETSQASVPESPESDSVDNDDVDSANVDGSGADNANDNVQGDAERSKSVTSPVSADVALSPEQLAVRIKPLTREQLETELKAWQGIVQEVAEQIAEHQGSLLATNDVSEEGAEESAEAGDATRTSALEQVIALKEEQGERLRQFQVVVDAYQRKGGDGEPYQLYIDALRGVDLKATDAEMLWKNLKGWLRSDQGGMLWAGRLLAFVVLLLIARLASGLIASLVRRWLRRSSRLSKLAEQLISRTLRHVLMLIGFLLALAAVGVDVGPLLAAVGATGFIIGFALQGTLSNFASGMMILLNRPFDVGDVVEAGGVTGTVEEMTLVSTTFLSFDNQRIIVPNNEIWNKVITNITANKTRRVDLEFGVSYDDDLERVRQILVEEATGHPLVLDEPTPVVKMHKIGDSSILFICRPWSKTEDYWTVYWELLANVKRRFDDEGVSLPYPQREVHVHKTDSAQ